jgi:hypothetical protein
MLNRKQMEDAAGCWGKSCSKCTMSQIKGCCTDQLAKVALELLDTLKRLEWLESDYGEKQCPMCRNYILNGHKPECELTKLLKEE